MLPSDPQYAYKGVFIEATSIKFMWHEAPDLLYETKKEKAKKFNNWAFLYFYVLQSNASRNLSGLVMSMRSNVTIMCADQLTNLRVPIMLQGYSYFLTTVNCFFFR